MHNELPEPVSAIADSSSYSVPVYSVRMSTVKRDILITFTEVFLNLYGQHPIFYLTAFLIVPVSRHISGDLIKNNELGRECGKYVEGGRSIQGSVGNVKERDHMKVQGRDGTIILKRIS